MNRIEPSPSHPGWNLGSAVKTTVILVALAAIAGAVYHLIQNYFTLSSYAQRLRNRWRITPPSLYEWDMILLAKTIESVKNQIQHGKSYKIKFHPFFSLRSRKLLVSACDNQTLRVQYIETTLGQGGFGKVVRLFDLETGEMTALKVAQPPKQWRRSRDYLAKAEEDLQKEHRNLMLIHESNRNSPLGVQDKPLSGIMTIIKLYRSHSVKRRGYEGTLYDCSLDNVYLISLPLKTRLFIAYQILVGMEILLACKLISHDLKLSNILYRYRGNQAHISDFGGVTHEDKLGDELSGGLVHTPAFGDSRRLKVAQSVPIGFVQRHLVRNSEKCSTGLLVFSILTGQLATVETPLLPIWQQTKFPPDKDYAHLFTALEKCTQTGFFNALFKTDISSLRDQVHALYLKC